MNEKGVEVKKSREQVLEESKTEPLKYVLEIANVTNGEELVDKLAQHETRAGFEKVFTKLKQMTDLKKVKVVFKSLNYLGDMDLEHHFRGGPTLAAFQQATNTFAIDTTYSNVAEIGDFFITVLHELFHHVFRGADFASGMNILYGIPNIKNTIHKLPIHNKYRDLYELVLHNVSKQVVGEHYGLSSVDEFISESYSNPEFQLFLKTVDLKNKRSVSSKTKDLLLSVVTLNARIISHNVTEQDAFSAFKRIDLESLDLLEDFEKNLKEREKMEKGGQEGL